MVILGSHCVIIKFPEGELGKSDLIGHTRISLIWGGGGGEEDKVLGW